MSVADAPASLAARALALLEQLADDPQALVALNEAERARLLTVCGQLSRPAKHERKAFVKAQARARRQQKRAADGVLLAKVGIRELRALPVYTPTLPEGGLLGEPVPAPTALADVGDQVDGDDDVAAEAMRLAAARMCYVCKARFDALHHFYDSMCAACAALNWEKRHQTCDLTGRYAIVTGARVKIGYYIALKLLRAGCHVVVVTRFARDAAARYSAEPDFAQFAARLQVHGVDLRHTPSVEHFAATMLQTLPRLDLLINNACQTVRRPSGFYDHLVADEQAAWLALPAAQQGVLATWHDAQAAAALSQVPMLPEDALRGDHLFPAGRRDADLQQVDLREFNSWRMRLHEVPTNELIEVQLVNAIAPFVLNARLKPLMMQVPTRDAHIVNVSAMEGQFYRKWKTDKHPHTNMAKAALNMLTRTSAADYVRDGIYMNAVDTGWVTDEDPVHLAARKQHEHGFHPPLDIVDGAARVLDPAFVGYNTGHHVWGKFLKDYRAVPW
ncbi:MAG: SDR family oxidoreductase [Myxococcales bacterium]|nr:SDR family oxidoreductase [Myxococcales bacterium]